MTRLEPNIISIYSCLIAVSFTLGTTSSCMDRGAISGIFNFLFEISTMVNNILWEVAARFSWLSFCNSSTCTAGRIFMSRLSSSALGVGGINGIVV